MSDKMMETIRFSADGGLARVILNRPDVHNAFNDIMIRELDTVFDDIRERNDLRVVVLTGEGRSFCAGADLNWMRRVKDYSYEENYQESLELANVLYKIYTLPKPTIACVNGAAIGGGTGLVAVCDVAIASRRAKFSFSEVKLGLIPACISPYVLKKCGEGNCREFFLTGERLTAEKAFRAGLVNQVVEPEEVEKAVNGIAENLLTSGPAAITQCKELLRRVSAMSLEKAREYTAEVIAKLRMSDEGQEGMAAFLEKRKPKWTT